MIIRNTLYFVLTNFIRLYKLKSKIMNKRLIYIPIVVVLLGGCTALKELVTFTKCEFRYKMLNSVTLAGIDIKSKTTVRDFTVTELAKLTTTALGGTIPVRFRVILEAGNPNTQQASVSKIEWIAYIDGNEIVSGALNERVTIPPNNGRQDIPLDFEFDLVKVAGSNTARPVAELALALMDIGSHSSKLTIKVKPTVTVGAFDIQYPGYFTVTKEFSSGN